VVILATGTLPKKDSRYYHFGQHYDIYRVSQEERTIFWEVIVSAILSKKLYMNMCPIPNGFRDRAILPVWLGRPVLSFPPALLRKGRSIFREVIVSVILSKKLYKNVCPIPKSFRDRAI
jgi:hypothetical protein